MLSKEKQVELLNRIEKKLQPFGSRAFGCAKPDSDYDYICTDEQMIKIIRFLEANNHEYMEYQGKSSNEFEKIPENNLYNEKNIKFNIDNKTINLISYSLYYYDKAIDIAKILIEISKNKNNAIIKDFLNNKESRIKIVNGFFNAGFAPKIYNEYNDIIDPNEIPF